MKIFKLFCLFALLCGAGCTGVDDDTPTGSIGGDNPDPENPSGALMLNVSSRFRAADGTDAIVFKVTKGDSDRRCRDLQHGYFGRTLLAEFLDHAGRYL